MIVCILRLSQISNATQIKQPGKYVAFEDLSTSQNATQMNKPGKYVAFEELGGFENIWEERILSGR